MPFRVKSFDPVLIIYQILCIQTLYYTLYCLFLSLFSIFSETRHLSFIFNSDATANLNITALLILISTHFFHCYTILLIVGKAKSCLDFLVTNFIIHFIICCYEYGLPKSSVWWLINALIWCGTVLWAEYICMKNEMAPIAIAASAMEGIKKLIRKQSDTIPLHNLN